MKVTIDKFGGIIPRASPHNLGATQASIAHDVKLRNGRLEPWRERCDFSSVLPTDVSFYIHGCCPIAWATIVQSAEVSPDWGRFYISGRIEDAEVVTLDNNCSPTYYKLGVPPPITPPRINGTESCGRSSDARSYVYTYVNLWGEESAPSPTSNILTVDDDSTVTITGIELPPDGYGIKYANIYRATTGFRPMDGKQQKPLTDFMYVYTIEFPTTTFIDNIAMANLSHVLETDKVRMPPSGLSNIVSIEGVVRLAGTVKNRVHISENFQPYNWPVKYDLTLDSTIIHMGNLDQKLYVTTDTQPYVIDVSSCEDMKCTPVLDAGIKLPDIACKYASSAIITRHGFIYSSPLGLVLIDPSAQFHILTSKWFSEDDWQELQPDTVRLAYWEGFLFCITDEVSFILNIDGKPYQDMEGSELVTISDKPVDLRIDNVGKLFMLEDGKITIWNTGTALREFTWVSRELTGGQSQPGSSPLGNTWSPTSAKIRTDDTEFTLIAPAEDKFFQRRIEREVFTRTVISESPFKLPRVGRHMWYKIKLQGKFPIEFFDMGTSDFTVNIGT